MENSPQLLPSFLDLFTLEKIVYDLDQVQESTSCGLHNLPRIAFLPSRKVYVGLSELVALWIANPGCMKG